MISFYRKHFIEVSFLLITVFIGSVFGAQTARRINGMEEETNLGRHIIYVSPNPGSSYLTPQSKVIIRSDENLSPAVIGNNLLFVIGTSSGKHEGLVTLAKDNRTILFQPQIPFSPGETVDVSMANPILASNGDTVEMNPFSFSISATNLNDDRAAVSEIGYGNPSIPVATIQRHSPLAVLNTLPGEFRASAQTDTLPSDLPVPTVTKLDSPSSGYIFISTNMNHSFYKKYGNYLMIVNNQGQVLFYRNTGVDPAWDFNIQPTGQLTYFTPYGKGWFYIMNSSLQVVDSLTAANGYYGDGHEMRILPNGNIFILADDYEYVDMSKIVPGGNTDAKVVDVVIQEFDKNGNLIFNWRCIDHFKITDALGQNLDSTLVDPFHCNAIAVDPDGTILLSSRHLSEITKIDPETGNIIWRLGGKNNQFNFVNDTIGFSYQHDIRRLTNGDITLMDNGNMHTPPFSRGVEYRVDEVSKIATLVWQFRHVPDAYNPFMGNVERLSNGNTFIGWGGAATPAITEVRPDGSTALEMTFPYDSVWTYRAYKHPFLFVSSPTLDDTVQAGDSTNLVWRSSGVRTVDVDYSLDGGKTWSNIAANYPAHVGSLTVPVPIHSGSSLQFRIVQIGSANEGMTYLSDTVNVVGETNGIKTRTAPYSFELSDNYPNPFNPTTTISYQIATGSHVTLRVYNILGQLVTTLVDATLAPGKYSVKFNGSGLASGVYFYRLKTSAGFVQVKKMVFEK